MPVPSDLGRGRVRFVPRASTPLTASTGAPTPLRVFSASRDQRRFRRATDVFLLVSALLGLAAVIATYPPSRLERSLSALLHNLPGPLDPLWGAFYDALAVWAVALVVVAVAARRGAVWLQALGSVVITVGVTLVSGRIAFGRWPDLGESLRLRVDDTTFPALRVAVCAALILTVSPHLVRPVQSFGRWVLVLGVLGAALAESAPPSANLAAFLVAVIAATLVRLSFGTSAGHPSSGDVLSALRELGVSVDRLEASARQSAGVFVARAPEAEEGAGALLVKVYGRDAYDTQLLEKLWRTVLYQGEGPRVRLSRIEAVEHEALVTLLAAQAGVTTNGVVVAAESASGDAILVLRDASRPLGGLNPDAIDDDVLSQCWHALTTLGAAGIAHNRIDPETIAKIAGDVGFVEFDRGTIAPRADQLLMDRAQLLATTAALAGDQRALTAAVGAIGADGVAAVLPYLQPAAFGPTLRRALRSAGVDVDDLRAAAGDALGVEVPEPLKLRRATWWSLAQIALLMLAASAIIGALSGLDYNDFAAYVTEAAWGWIALGLVVAQLPRVTQAVATLGSVPAKLPFFPVYVMQLATGYMNLALPSNLARMAINIRFFRRQGIAPATSVTAGAIDSFASTITQALLLLTLIAFSAGSLDFDLEIPSGPSVRSLVMLVCLVVAGAIGLLLVRRVRAAIVERARRWWPEVRATIHALRAGSKLALLVGGSLATEILFAISLGVFAEAFGYDIGLANLLLINISVSLLASFVPVPGGIGVAEFGLTVGLVASGMPDEVALVTAILYRIATFYAPPLWGFFAMRWLRATDRL